VNKVQAVTRVKNLNVVVVQVETGRDIATVHHVGEVQIGVGEAEVARESKVGNKMAEISEVVARKDIVIVTRGGREVETETVVKDLEEIGSTICTTSDTCWIHLLHICAMQYQSIAQFVRNALHTAWTMKPW
jgi:hypothetical protein